MTQAQPKPAPLADTASPQDTLDLRRQLRQALAQLNAIQHRCEQLETQLQDGQLREGRHLHRAEHDDLTGLFNRAAFRERLGDALASGLQVAVVMLDLDGFKLINDNHGHAAGDEVLRIIAARMTHALRTGDVLGRLGGDEFACLLQDAGGPADLAVLAGKLDTSIALPMLVGGHRLSLRASLGLAVSPSDGSSVDTLLTHADEAMYRAKRYRQAQRAMPPRALTFDGAQTAPPPSRRNGTHLSGEF